MDYTLSNEKAKRQAKLMVEYLQSQGLKIPLGHALETVARMHDAKSWNHLSAKLDEQPAALSVLAVAKPLPALQNQLSQSSQPQHPEAQLLYWTKTPAGREEKAAHVLGEAYSYDRVEYDDFDAGLWLRQATDEQILALAKAGWTMEYDQSSFGEAFHTWGDLIDVVHSYVVDHNGQCDSEYWTKMGVDLDVKEAMAFLRAFRYPLFVQLALGITFEDAQTAEDVAFYGYGPEHYQVVLRPTEDSPWQANTEQWAYIAGAYELKGNFKSANEAWSALGIEVELLGLFKWDDERLGAAQAVKPDSGFSSWSNKPKT